MQKYSKSQINTVFKFFFESPLTMKEVEVKTGIDRAYICRYVSNLRKLGKICRINTILCPITKHKAGQLTTNPMLFNHANESLLNENSTTVTDTLQQNSTTVTDTVQQNSTNK